jgi:hypothetical protein
MNSKIKAKNLKRINFIELQQRKKQNNTDNP